MYPKINYLSKRAMLKLLNLQKFMRNVNFINTHIISAELKTTN